MVEIVVNQKHKELLRYSSDGGIVTIGRSSSNEIHLLSPAVSDRHARVSLFDDICVIQRLNDEGRLLVNGRETDRARLYQHDVVTIGPFTLSIEGEKLARPSYDRLPENDDETEAVSAEGAAESANAIGATFTSFSQDHESTDAPADTAMPERRSVELADIPTPGEQPDGGLLATGVDVLSGPARGRRILFTGKSAKLGIKDESLVSIKPFRHGYLVAATSHFVAVTLNGERLTDKPEPIKHGDLIEFSELKARFFVNPT